MPNINLIQEHDGGGPWGVDTKSTKETIGGQALIEGIMMRGSKTTAVSLRMPDGSIETEIKSFSSIRKKNKFFNLPIIRGVVAFIESMVQGMELITESAEKTMPIEDEDITKEQTSKMMDAISVIAPVFGIGLSVLLFVWAPSFLFDLINSHLVAGAIEPFRALIEGFMRVVIFVLYMWITSKTESIQRVYMYHGAEHKTIFCYEHDKTPTVENVRKESRFHPRCGTSFIFVTILLSIIISAIISFAFPVLTQTRWLWITTKLLMMPFIMGIGFEFIQFAGKHDNKFTRLLSAPGLWMQRITTKEPTDDMIEVAICAAETVFMDRIYTEPPFENPEKSKKDSFDKFLEDKASFGEYLKNGAAKLCEEHPDIVQDIINS